MDIPLLTAILVPMMIGVCCIYVYYDDANPREFYVEMGGVAALLPAILVLGIAAAGFGLYNLVQYLLR